VLPRNVLIFHSAALGDFILTWPLAMALGRVMAQSRIIYITHGQKGRLAERLLGIEWSEIEAGWHALFAQTPKLPEPATRMLPGARQIISFVSTGDDLWADNVRALAPNAELIFLRARPDPERARHACHELIDQLAPHPIIHEATRQMLRAIGGGIGGQRPRGQRIVIHPGSGSEAKNWPLDRFIDLARRLKADGAQTEFTLGEVELERWDASRLAAMSDAAPVIRPPSYLDLADLLGGARLVITNDSGPAHLAGVLGATTLCLFGPTDPAVWRPLGPRVYVLRGDPLQSLDVSTVYNQASALLGG
jgi:ADP-heptose:LPS heptosyltransferase